jgi:cell division protein FtsN
MAPVTTGARQHGSTYSHEHSKQEFPEKGCNQYTMAHDFAKTRARRANAREPAPPPAPNKSLLITGVVSGLFIGFFVSFVIYMSGLLPPLQPLSAEPSADTEATLAAAQQRRSEELETAAARLQLEFYKELPNYEVIVDNMPQAAPPLATSPAAAPTTTPTPATEQNGAIATIIEDITTQPLPTLELDEAAIALATAAIPPAITPAPGAPAFMIQAGAFQQEGSAVAQSMRLSALGLESHVRKEALLGKTLFLVQAGPYSTREQVSQAERILRSNSIDSIRIGLSQ